MNSNLDTQTLVTMAIIGMIAGFLASVLLGGSGGLLRYLIIGVIGSFVGGYVLNAAGVNLGIANAFARQVAVSTIGAVIVVILARIVA